MTKLWAKLIIDTKIVKDLVYIIDTKFEYSEFFDYISGICYKLDVPTPILMKTHIFNYAKFNFCTFRKDDFVEDFAFDSLIIENIVV